MTGRFEARNPAFDVTPAALIAAIVTERGVHRRAASQIWHTAATEAYGSPRIAWLGGSLLDLLLPQRCARVRAAPADARSARPAATALQRIQRAALRALRRADGLARRALPRVRGQAARVRVRARRRRLRRRRAPLVARWKERGLRVLGGRGGRARRRDAPAAAGRRRSSFVPPDGERMLRRGHHPARAARARARARAGSCRSGRRSGAGAGHRSAARAHAAGAAPKRRRRLPGARRRRCRVALRRRRRLHDRRDRRRPPPRRCARAGARDVDVVTFARTVRAQASDERKLTSLDRREARCDFR